MPPVLHVLKHPREINFILFPIFKRIIQQYVYAIIQTQFISTNILLIAIDLYVSFIWVTIEAI